MQHSTGNMIIMSRECVFACCTVCYVSNTASQAFFRLGNVMNFNYFDTPIIFTHVLYHIFELHILSFLI